MTNREIVLEMDDVIDSVMTEIENGGTVTIAGTGTSMSPFIEAGTDKIVLSHLSENKKIRIGEIYLYRRANGRYSVHRVYSVNGDTVYMCGDAQITLEKIRKSDLRAIVTKIIKPEKTICCTSLPVLLFHRIRMKLRQLRYRHNPVRKISRLLKKLNKN